MSDLSNYPIPLQIKILRKNNNMTQMDLAEKLGVTKQSISSWEIGSSKPSMYNIHQIDSIFKSNLSKQRTDMEMKENVVPYETKLEQIIEKLNLLIDERQNLLEKYMDVILENHEYYNLVKKLMEECKKESLPEKIKELIDRLSEIKAI